MKISMEDRESFAHWFMISCVSSDENTHSDKESKFNQIVNAKDWDSKNIELSVKVNGHEFSNLEDVFNRIEQHINEKVEERISQESFDNLRIQRIQSILNARNKDELEWS